MAFIGNTVQTQGFTPAIDYFSGNGSTVTFTLSRPVASVAQMIVAVDNVIQNPSTAYSVSGSSITFTSAPLAGSNNIWVEYTSLITTYAAISQSPSVIGDITTSGGFFAQGTFGNSYTDGTVIDYVTGNVRITGGAADGVTLYTGGTTARSSLLSLNANGALGVGASPSYGTTGQYLQSTGTGTPPTWVTPSSGAVVQVKSTTLTTLFSTTSTSYTAITGLSVSITPTSASNKIWVTANIVCGNSVATVFQPVALYRNGSILTGAVGTASGSRTQATTGAGRVNDVSDTYNLVINYLDSPATTSATTYQPYISNNNGSTANVNANGLNANNAATGTYISTITVMEVTP